MISDDALKTIYFGISLVGFFILTLMLGFLADFVINMAATVKDGSAFFVMIMLMMILLSLWAALVSILLEIFSSDDRKAIISRF